MLRSASSVDKHPDRPASSVDEHPVRDWTRVPVSRRTFEGPASEHPGQASVGWLVHGPACGEAHDSDEKKSKRVRAEKESRKRKTKELNKRVAYIELVEHTGLACGR